MSKLRALAEVGIVIYEGAKEIKDVFEDSISSDFYSSLDKLIYLTDETLGIDSGGNVSGNIATLASAFLSLGYFIIWGVLLFYGFRSLFTYFLSKKVEVPWKLVVRMVIFGVLTNAAFFISFSGIFFIENITMYIRETAGYEETSFACFENRIDSLDLEAENEEETDFYTMEDLMRMASYFLSFGMGICFGIRFILIKLLILTSPIFFAFGGSQLTEEIFYFWCRIFFLMISVQIFVACIVPIVNSSDFEGKLISKIILISGMILFCKIINLVMRKVLINSNNKPIKL